MASFSRRPATRNNPSSTQEVDTEAVAAAEEEDEPVLTQMDVFEEENLVIDDSNYSYAPQFDNPSSLLPDNDDDYALKEYMNSQQQISQREQEQFKAQLEDEFQLNFDPSDNEKEEQDNAAATHHCTQGTLDAASILAGGFNPTADDDTTRRNKDTEEDKADVPADDDALAAELASFSREHGLDGLDEEEKKHVENCNEGKNSTKHQNKQASLETQFMDTIAIFGGHLKTLATESKPNKNHLTEPNSIDKRFYAVCGGEKNPAKHKIVNNCLVLCAMKWNCKSGRNKGKALQSSSFNKCMEQLFIVLAEKGIRYSYLQDFNKKGDFHGVVKGRWRKIRQSDPEFGTGSNRARADKDLFRKFVQAVRDRNIRPCEDPEHLVLCVIFILGFCCGLRGSSEHVDLMTDNVFIGECEMSDGPDLCGLNWGGVKVPHSKCKQLKLNSTRLTRDEDVILSFVEDPDLDWDPFRIFCFYIDHCHPQATKFYARIIKQGCNEAKTLKQQFGKDIWCAESGPSATRSNWNMGPSKHRSLCKEIVRLSGADNWDSCTGHALRALCITHCVSCGLSAADVAAKVCHSSLHSQKTCAEESTKRKANRMAAMNPSGAITKKRKGLSKVDAKVAVADTKIEDIVVIDSAIPQCQPMLQSNRNKFERIAGINQKASVASKPKEVAMFGQASVSEEKENESPNSKLERLMTENKILKLQQENARIKAELTSVSLNATVPRHRRSYPSENHRSIRFVDTEYLDNDGHDECKCHRRSYPCAPRTLSSFSLQQPQTQWQSPSW